MDHFVGTCRVFAPQKAASLAFHPHFLIILLYSGLSETKVNSAEEVLALMRKAQNNRQVGETNMNKQSSRSHCIFTLRVQAKRKIADGSVLEVSGKLHCVDLAGSECAKSADLDKKDDQQASRERERMNINRSLLTLGRVVSMLKEQSQNKKNKNIRIPYRDSKLTRILQESLGGRCKTCLIATVSPSVTAIEESMSTLNYAQAANGIINKPVTSSLMTAYGSSLAVAGDKKPSGDATTVEHWHEMEVRLEYMQSQVEEAQQALARKHLQQQELIERAENAETAKTEAETRLEETQREKAALETEIEKQVTENKALVNKLALTEQTLRETAAILAATQETESRLTAEAQELMLRLRTSIANGQALHNTIVKNREEEVRKKGATKSFHNAMMALLNEITTGLTDIAASDQERNQAIIDSASELCNSQKAQTEINRSFVTELRDKVESTVSTLRHILSGESGIQTAVSAFASNLTEKCDNLHQLGTKHREGLGTISQEIREKLRKTAEDMNMMEKQYSISTSEILDSLESDVKESKTKLSEMIQSILKTLSTERGERSKSFESLSEMVQELMKTSSSTASAIGQVATNEVGCVKRLIEILEAEQSRHTEVECTLNEQTDFLNEQDAKISSQFTDQHKALQSQRAIFDERAKTATEIYDGVMANILEGVKDLVKREFALISEHQQTSSEAFVETNEVLLQSSSSMADSTQSIFGRLLDTTQHLKSHSSALHNASKKTSNLLHTTCQSLQSIQADGSRMGTAIQESSNSILSRIASTTSADKTQSDDLCTLIADEATKFEDDLHQNVFEKAVPRVKGLATSVEKLVSTTKNGIKTTAENLQTDLESSQVFFSNDTTKWIKEVKNYTSNHKQVVESAVAQLATSSDDLYAQSANKTSLLNDTFAAQTNSFNEYYTSIAKKCGNDQKNMNKAIDKELTRAVEVKGSVVNFSEGVIKMDTECPPVEARLNIEYSEELSATPADHVIVERLGTADASGGGSTTTLNSEAMKIEEVTELPDAKELESAPKSPLFKEKTNSSKATKEEREEDEHVPAKRRSPSNSSKASAKRARTCA